MINKIKDFFLMLSIKNKLNKILKNPRYLQKIDINNEIFAPCDMLIEKYPKNAKPYCFKAALYFALGDYKNSIKYYQEVRENFTLSGFILNTASRQNMLRCCDALIQENPDDAALYAQKADILQFVYNTDKKEEVLACYDKALSLNPDNLAEVINSKIEFLSEVALLKNIDNNEELLSYYDEAIKDYPQHIAQLVQYKADFLYCYMEWMLEEVCAVFDEAAENCPQYSEEILAKKMDYIKQRLLEIGNELSDIEGDLQKIKLPDEIEIPDFLRK